MGQSVIKNPRKVYSQAGGDPSLTDRVAYLEQSTYKITYYAEINAASGTITKPTGSTILTDQFASGADAYVTTIVNSRPTTSFPQTAGGVTVDVTSFDTSGNFVLTGTPSAFPCAIIYILTIQAVDWQNLTTANILDLEDVNSAPASGYTASRVLISDANGKLVIADTATYPSLTEFSYVKGVTSAVQTQIDNKTSTRQLYISNISPADGITYSFNEFWSTAVSGGSLNTRPIIFTQSKVIVGATLTILQSANGSNETVTLELYNITTAASVGTIGTFTSDFGAASIYNARFTELNLSVNDTDLYGVRLVCPTFATNPTAQLYNLNLMLR